MLRSLRVLAVTASLAPLLAPSAMADFAIHCPTTTDGQSLRMAQHIAWAADKGGVVSPTKGCLFSEKIYFSVKGDIKDGEIISVKHYSDTDECPNSNEEGSPAFATYYRDEDGSYVVPLCAWPPSRTIVEAYMRQKAELERLARQNPRDVAKQTALARFFIGWNDLSRAGPALAKVAELAPSGAETQLLQAELLLLSQPDWLKARERGLVVLAKLAASSPVARLLLERTRSEIAYQSQKRPDGAFSVDAKMPEIRVSELDLTGRDLTGIWLPDGALPDLHAPRSDWTAAGIDGLDLTRANLQETIFTESNLEGTKLVGADLQRARFVRAIVAEADFTGAQMQLAVLRNVSARSAKFTNADLRGAEVDGGFGAADFTSADLRGADMRKAELEGTVLTGVRYDCNTRFPRGFRPELRGMVFADKSVCIGGAQAGK